MRARNKERFYVPVNMLSRILTEKNRYDWIANAIKNSIKGKYFDAYPSLSDAQETRKYPLKDKIRYVGIAEFELDSDAFKALPSSLVDLLDPIISAKTNEEKEERLKLFLKALYIDGFQFPLSILDDAKYEKEHLQSICYHSDTTSFALNQPPLLYLSQVHPSLRFLLMIDHKLFILENWRHYNAREPGCVADLFLAAATHVYNYVSASNSKKPLIELEDVIELQKTLSTALFKSSSEKRSGVIRQHYNAFPIYPDTATVAGIKELLIRIRKDKNPQGFMIGSYKRIPIISLACAGMVNWLFDGLIAKKKLPIPQSNDALKRADIFRELELMKAAAIDDVYHSLKDEVTITKQDIEKAVNQFLDDFAPYLRVAKGEYFWGNLRYYLQDMSSKTLHSPTRFELDFEITYARNRAYARAGDDGAGGVDISQYSDDDIESLANEIYSKIKEEGSLHLFPPEAGLAKQWALEAVDSYNKEIVRAGQLETRMKIIDCLAHELEILHLFHDVNCRTAYFLMNELFLACGIKWSTEYNPNRLDALGSDERMEQHKQGICRTDYIIANPDLLIKRNEQIDKVFLLKNMACNDLHAYFSPEQLKAVKFSDEYDGISMPFNGVLERERHAFSTMIDKLVKEYDLLCSLKTKFFNAGKCVYAQMREALKKLGKTQDFAGFFQHVSFLEYNAKVRSDAERMKKLAGMEKKMQYNTHLSSVVPFSP